MINLKLAPEHKETVKRLEKIEDELKRKAVGSGLTAAAKPIKATMAALTPVDTGALKKSINQLRISGKASRRLSLFNETIQLRPDQIAIIVGPNKRVDNRRRSSLAHILEFGARAHRIAPTAGRGLLRLGNEGFARTVNHPGIKGSRYMQRALEQNEGQIEELFFQGAAKRLDKLL